MRQSMMKKKEKGKEIVVQKVTEWFVIWMRLPDRKIPRPNSFYNNFTREEIH